MRKLTIRECYRIMGFPDTFKIDKKKQEAYKQIGNSICVPKVYSIAKQIKTQGLLTGKVYEKPQITIRRNYGTKDLEENKILELIVYPKPTKSMHY